ncbi:MAG: DinB family protein [Phototrophicaceae bacterium]
MSLDLSPLLNGLKWGEYAKTHQVTPMQLHETTVALYATIRELLADCIDAHITFMPFDPHAKDPDAKLGEENIGWGLGHLVAHVTATNEENASIASVLARGIEFNGRLRYETEWQTITTVEQTLQRLNESERMVLAYLNAFPDSPNTVILRQFTSEKAQAYFGELNSIANFLLGLGHMNEHLAQFREVKRQALEAHPIAP